MREEGVTEEGTDGSWASVVSGGRRKKAGAGGKGRHRAKHHSKPKDQHGSKKIMGGAKQPHQDRRPAAAANAV